MSVKVPRTWPFEDNTADGGGEQKSSQPRRAAQQGSKSPGPLVVALSRHSRRRRAVLCLDLPHVLDLSSLRNSPRRWRPGAGLASTLEEGKSPRHAHIPQAHQPAITPWQTRSTVHKLAFCLDDVLQRAPRRKPALRDMERGRTPSNGDLMAPRSSRPRWFLSLTPEFPRFEAPSQWEPSAPGEEPGDNAGK